MPWSDSNPNKQLYIDGFQTLAKNGVIQKMSDSHGKLFSNGIHWSAIFLPWHRAFILDVKQIVYNNNHTAIKPQNLNITVGE